MEAQVLSEYNHIKMNAVLTQQAESKLPKITVPQSWQQASVRSESNKNSSFLPLLKPNLIDSSQNDQIRASQTEKNDFVLQIEEKLKMVMQNINHGESQEDSQGGCQDQFEQLVEQNKEKIKQQKYKLSIKPNNQIRQQRSETKSKSKTLKLSTKNDNLEEKKLKELRQASFQNKYLVKKKELVIQRQEVIERAAEKMKVAKQQKEEVVPGINKETQELKQPNRQLNNAKNYNSSSNKQSKHQKSLRNSLKNNSSSKNILKDEKAIPRNLPEQPKAINLFDNIHNLLQNPIKNRVSSETRKNSNAKSIKTLEQKINAINNKLGINESAKLKINRNEVEQKTVSNWKRIDYNQGKDFKCHCDSNFQKEVQKINTLQQKSNDYLSQLVNHQKTLVQLTLIKKIKPNVPNNTN